ncbi:hypothetical protein DMENIID0001_002300 [Sergentomyia squamirostris]
MKRIPEIIVALMYFPCGAWMSLNVYISLTGNSLYSTVSLWPELLGCISACLTAGILFGTRALWKKVVFIHFYLMACGATLLVISGVLLIITTERPIPALYIGGIGHGIIYISGLSYIQFRAAGRRAFRLTLCHFVYILAFTTTTHGIYIYGPLGFTYTFGSFIIYSSASCVGLFLINELLHGLGIYDYKKCLDSELHLANEKKDNFESALEQQVDPAPADNNYWATRFNVQPIQFAAQRRKRLAEQNIITLGLILSKINNSMVFTQVFMGFALITTLSIGQGIEFIYLYFLFGGLVFGCVISLTVNMKHLYVVYTLAMSICLLTASILFSIEHYDESAVFFWLFFFFHGFGYFISDIGILDVANLKYSEIALAGGYFIQYMLVALTRFGHYQYQSNTTLDAMLWKYSGSYVGVSLVLLIVIVLLYKKTLNLSLLDIQYVILYNEDRWKAKNHEMIATCPPFIPPNEQNQQSTTASTMAIQDDDRPAFMKAQGTQGSISKSMDRSDESSMFHNPWYPQHPTNIPLQQPVRNNTNGYDNSGFDYGSVRPNKMVPRINKVQ